MATIYKILSPCLQECYVGSTIQRVEKRWTDHKSNRYSSSILFKNYGYDNCKFVVLEVCPLEEQLYKEQWWIDHSVGAVNMLLAFQPETRENYDKIRYETQKEERLAQAKEYYEKNKEEKKAYGKAYYERNKEEKKAYAKAQYEKNKE